MPSRYEIARTAGSVLLMGSKSGRRIGGGGGGCTIAIAGNLILQYIYILGPAMMRKVWPGGVYISSIAWNRDL